MLFTHDIVCFTCDDVFMSKQRQQCVVNVAQPMRNQGTRRNRPHGEGRPDWMASAAWSQLLEKTTTECSQLQERKFGKMRLATVRMTLLIVAGIVAGERPECTVKVSKLSTSGRHPVIHERCRSREYTCWPNTSSKSWQNQISSPPTQSSSEYRNTR